jgi:hypothetical protein
MSAFFGETSPVKELTAASQSELLPLQVGIAILLVVVVDGDDGLVFSCLSFPIT